MSDGGLGWDDEPYSVDPEEDEPVPVDDTIETAAEPDPGEETVPLVAGL